MCYSSLSPPAFSTCMLSRFSRVRLCATPRTVAYQAPLSMGFSRQEYWSGVPFPSPGDLPNPGIKSESPVAPVSKAKKRYKDIIQFKIRFHQEEYFESI